MINNKTRLFMSASQHPGNFGATVFNKLFSAKKINAIYLPRKFDNADDLLNAIKSMQVEGCAVSTPLKGAIIDYLDSVDSIAKKLNSVNTIKVTDGSLSGYNTDWIGAKAALGAKFKTAGFVPTSARILGSGGVVPSLVYALNSFGIFDISVSARNLRAASQLEQCWKVKTETLDFQNRVSKDILVNTIPTIAHENDLLFASCLKHSKIAFDLMVCPTASSLIQMALESGKETIQGYEMAVYQLLEQYLLYFGEKVSEDEIFRIVKADYLGK